ncbi:hypothetical protein KSS87_013244 [Heliosperma pusillum]|nr:hypothetical protein KSS87_013244 [Heliosperma pusillum]
MFLINVVMEQLSGSRIHGFDSVEFWETEDGSGAHLYRQFFLINPKEPDSATKSLLQVIAAIYYLPNTSS